MLDPNRKQLLREMAESRNWARDADAADAILELLEHIETYEDGLHFGEAVCAKLVEERDAAKRELRSCKDAHYRDVAAMHDLVDAVCALEIEKDDVASLELHRRVLDLCEQHNRGRT